ncbi:MAG TPA: hypothetical protein VHW64_13565 [Nocardioides sp.]|jgi:hypothetical protein|uniref:hypothetical protein n=1 Tax=Nocardioides sp. TaxID=35761 RepID=UPI002E304FF9|nr:hypothetical protein [Nocardioides sp.]HEX3931728.1 hypothetical protein [Nocardioides sp.]
MPTSTSQTRRLLAGAAAGCVALALAAQLPAQAAPGAGTRTTITAPVNDKVVLSQVGAEGHWTIKGTASGDVSEVNVYCLSSSNGPAVTSITVATAVKVSSGAFRSTVPVPSGSSHCRLRALPDGVNPLDDYLASYAGPVVNLDTWERTTSNFAISASAGHTGVSASAAGSCAIVALASTSADETTIGGTGGCLLSLANNVRNTGSSVVVDGHQAIPPPDDQTFGLTPISAVSSTFHATKANTVRWTDVEPLDRCATGAQWPPSSGTCVLTPSGVELRRVSTVLKDGQVRVRDEYRSTDGRRHVLKLAYLCNIAVNAQGLLGVRYHGESAFHDSTPGQKVTRLGHQGAGTMLVTADRLANQGDPSVSVQAVSWSRRPSRLVWAPVAEGLFEMDYRLVVPRGGSARLGFADSSALLTTGAQALGAKAQRDMMPAPKIVRPSSGDVIKGTKTTVSGVVSAGANGLPVTVLVNGHRVKLKVGKGGTVAKFKDTFSESLGKHRIKVVAKDAAGNRRSTSVRVVNKVVNRVGTK